MRRRGECLTGNEAAQHDDEGGDRGDPKQRGRPATGECHAKSLASKVRCHKLCPIISTMKAHLACRARRFPASSIAMFIALVLGASLISPVLAAAADAP